MKPSVRSEGMCAGATFGDGDFLRRPVAVIISPELHAHAELPEVVRADDAGGAGAVMCERREDDGHEQREHGKDAQELGAGEGGGDFGLAISDCGYRSRTACIAPLRLMLSLRSWGILMSGRTIVFPLVAMESMALFCSRPIAWTCAAVSVVVVPSRSSQR